MKLSWRSGKITPGKSGTRRGSWGGAALRNKSGERVAGFNLYFKAESKPERPQRRNKAAADKVKAKAKSPRPQRRKKYPI